jgi:hypothetical protein
LLTTNHPDTRMLSFAARQTPSTAMAAAFVRHSASGKMTVRIPAVMKQLAALLLLSMAAAAPAQQADEDAEHRADRLQTEALNLRVSDDIARRHQTNSRGQDSYKAATARYARQLQDWRRRVEACRAGYYDECQ